MRHVILPQAVRRVAPPLLNDFVALQKDVALVSILGPQEAFRIAQIVQGENLQLHAADRRRAALPGGHGAAGAGRRPHRRRPGGGGAMSAERGWARPRCSRSAASPRPSASAQVLRGVDLDRRRARGGGADRRLRLGQVDAAALHRPARGDRRRRHLPRRRGDHRPLGRRRSTCAAGSASSSRPTTSSRT